ncbi:phage head spike fiber domain-containing protein [Parasedimentitalea huanghaiensis]|uniref:Uncharacterized protein n=1 Tax=Parasedimentitalea huanghaiensis TaxID=2682100 RepID=A0A6L6WG95_9RHOB|nr:hypothetical protein [Zongyanglinia huanghaiensis]MVO16863.1 hypothetical protein [Zongyanglinia huanghaiensis]
MLGLGLGFNTLRPAIRSTSQVMADFIAGSYIGGTGPGILGLFDFSAAGSRNYINALGHLVTAAPGEPRSGHHEWLNGMWTPVGLLLEPSGTNKIAQAVANLTDWLVSGATFVAAADNFLGRFAGVVVTSGGETWHRARPSAEMAVVAGQTYSVTAFVKEGTSGRCRIAIRHEGLAAETHIRGEFGALETPTENAGTANVVHELAVPGGHMIYATYTALADGPVNVGIGPDSNVAGENITAYFLQFEEGHVPTSPILSAGAATSRAKDVLFISAETLSRHGGLDVIQNLTVHMAGQMSYPNLGEFSVLEFWNIYKDSGNRLGAKVDSVNGSGDLVVVHGVDGVMTYSGDASTWTPDMGVPFDIAASYSDTDMSVAEHGGFSTSKAVSGFPDLGGAAFVVAPDYPMTLSKLELRFGASGIDLAREMVA